MAHRSSSAALHAARTLLKFNTFEVIPPDRVVAFGVRPVGGLKATEAHISIIVDRATNAFELANLRPELKYWQDRLIYSNATAAQVGFFLNKILSAIDKIPKHPPDSAVPMVAGNSLSGMAWSKFPLSRAALEAQRVLFQFYDIVLIDAKKRQLPVEIRRLEVAKLIDVSLGIKGVVDARPRFEACLRALRQGSATEEQASLTLRRAGVLLEKLPNYEDREEETKLLV